MSGEATVKVPANLTYGDNYIVVSEYQIFINFTCPHAFGSDWRIRRSHQDVHHLAFHVVEQLDSLQLCRTCLKQFPSFDETSRSYTRCFILSGHYMDNTSSVQQEPVTFKDSLVT